MKIFKYITILTIGLLLFSVTSCDLTEVNDDPTRQGDVGLSLILPAAIGQTAYNQSALSARMSGIIMQHFRGFDAQQVAYTDYVITENEFNNYWNFGTYGGVLKDTRDLLDKGENEGQPYYVGIAKILAAEAYGYLTSSFGDVPQTDALLGTESLKPVFDTQEQTYDGLLTMLDEGISELSKQAVDGGPGGDDLIFGGDASLWILTAHALKARYMLHLSKRRGYAGIESELNQAFSSAADQPDFFWETALTSANPLAKFGIGRPGTLIIDFRFGDDMDQRGDPRQDKYMNTKLNPDGTVDIYEFYSTSNTDLVWAQLDSSIPLISYTELLLIRAEVELMANNNETAAQAALDNAINANMEQLGIDPSSAEVVAYKAAHADLSAGADAQGKLEIIMTEAYYALYGQQEQTVWTNFRRTGYPALIPSPNGTHGLNPTGKIPRRWIYPIDEKTTNAVNITSAIQRQFGKDKDLLSDDTWAFAN